MKIKVKYDIPIAYWIKGETEIDIDEENFDQVAFHDKVKIMEKIAEDQGEIPINVSSAYEVGYADIREIIKE